MSPRVPTVLRRGLALCYFALLFAAVLTPQPIRHSTTFADNGPFGIGWLADGIRNVLLFAPLGAFVSLERASLRRSVGIACAIAIGIELVQTLIPGRFSSPVDVLSNGLGAALGALGVRWAPILRRPPPRLARPFALGAALAATGLLLVSTALIVPVVPEGRYFGGFTPELRELSHYSGEVLEARLDDLSIPAGGPVPEDAPFPDRLRSRPVLELAFRPGASPPSLAPLVTLHDDHERELLLVGLDGDVLVARRRLRGADLGLENPLQRWDAVMPKGESILGRDGIHRIALHFDGPTWHARFDGMRLSDRRWTPGRGWALVIPMEWIPTAALVGLDVGWIALLALPAAYHAPRRLRGVAPLVGLVGALAAAPLVGAVAAASAAEWAALFGGMGFGLWLRAPDSDRTSGS